jgi:ubiquinone/menaquinone biosynthesis methyltransferase
MAADRANAARFEPAQDDVFARIAHHYDRLCDLFSLGAHRLWKARMAERLAACEAEVILDVASGTGDIPRRLLRRFERSGALPMVWVTDLSPAMLDIAREKLAAAGDQQRFALADAHDLREFETASIDVYSIAFGMKICDRARVMREAQRVLKPGGVFFCLEAARIPWPWLHTLYLTYMGWCLPMIARLAVHGDSSAYDYLLRGVRDFPDQHALCDELVACGFSEVTYENLTLGIVALHRARKPALPH